MGYQFDVDVQEIFEQRTVQWTRYGLPIEDVARMRTTITDMWSPRPGGWVPAWSGLAEQYEAVGEDYRAALAYGVAKFPSIVDEPRRAALSHQVAAYTRAASSFPVRFVRRTVSVPYQLGTVEIPVHVLSAPDATANAPVLLASGGVDTWKMDQHPILVALASALGCHVVGFDHPGTGECAHVPLDANAEAVVFGLVQFARGLTTGHVVHVGISFGGYFAARSGLRGDVDAAVVLGGPVQAAFTDANFRRLLAGMSDVVGNAMGFTDRPSVEEIVAVARTLDLGFLLAADRNAPMLVINGDHDTHVPLADTTVFSGRRDTDVVVIPGGTHCAVNKLDEVLQVIIDWVRRTVMAPTPLRGR